MDLAQFIMEADATSLIAASQIQKRIVREAENELRRMANTAKVIDDAFIARSKEKAKNLVIEKQRLNEINNAISEIGKKQKQVGDSDPMPNATKMARRHREVLNQVAYGLGDIMSVQGGVAEMIRASANNVQYMAAAIPGAAGKWAMFGATAAQGLGMMAAKLLQTKDNTKLAEESAREATKAFKELAEAVDDVSMKESDAENERKRRDLAEKAAKGLTAMERAREKFEPLERQNEIISKPVWETKMSEMPTRLGGAWSHAWTSLLNGIALTATAGMAPKPFRTPREELEDARREYVARRNESEAMDKMRDQATAGAMEKRMADRIEKAIDKSKPDFEREYLRGRDRGWSPEENKANIQAMLEMILPKEDRRAAGKLADKLMEEFKMAVSAQKIQDQAAAQVPGSEGLTAARNLLHEQKLAVEKIKSDPESYRYGESARKHEITLLENQMKATQNLVEAMEEANKIQTELLRRRVVEEGDSPLPAVREINPNGNGG